jgi:hypothetical protein
VVDGGLIRVQSVIIVVLSGLNDPVVNLNDRSRLKDHEEWFLLGRYAVWLL